MQVEFNAELLQRYDKSGPRYTSYPPANHFHDKFDQQTYRQQAILSNRSHLAAPLSLYMHIPFCDRVCFYCACNKIVTKDHTKADTYLEYLYKEISLQAELFDVDRQVNQLHWGGGTPTFLNQQQMATLMAKTRLFYNLHDNDEGEYSIEIDPRAASPATIHFLREIGFNRLSLGVQDFEPAVQKAVNRIQTIEQTQAVLEAAREARFKSISLDLIYGLPKQDVESFSRTLDIVIKMLPDRLSVFNYAHMPAQFKPQRRINSEELPTAVEKLQILQLIIERLTAAGYVYIGMDHFAHPEDELNKAQENGALYRNFQGYSTHADCDLVAMGVTGIGQIGNSYSQNVKTLDDYYEHLDNNQLAVFRGIELTDDDQIRRHVINRLMCDFSISWEELEQRFEIDARDYFGKELHELTAMQQDGLIDMTDQELIVKPVGRLLIRNICMEFDRYLSSESTNTYSKVI
jgi:oxygen-independent coproporphyrinogen-3 oxidase